MGRGRAKAKQTKVARELKYRSVGMDLGSLEAELRSPEDEAHRVPDAYADLAEEYDDGPDGIDEDDDGDEDYPLRKSG